MVSGLGNFFRILTVSGNRAGDKTWHELMFKINFLETMLKGIMHGKTCAFSNGSILEMYPNQKLRPSKIPGIFRPFWRILSLFCTLPKNLKKLFNKNEELIVKESSIMEAAKCIILERLEEEEQSIFKSEAENKCRNCESFYVPS